MNKNDFETAPNILNDFLIYIETIKGKSLNTVNEYFFDLRMFFKFLKRHKKIVSAEIEFDEIEISDVSIELIKSVELSDLYSFLSFLSRERKNSSPTRARKVASLKSFFNYLTNKAKLLEYNPANELESPKIVKRLPKYLNIEESKKLLEIVDGDFFERDFAIITLFLNCGMRLSELVNINISDIRDNKLTIIGKGNKERTIYLNKACMSAIDTYLSIRETNGVKDKDALFLSKRKQRISNSSVQKIVKGYIRQAGLDPKRYSVHKLRHTSATLMYKYGDVDIRALQAILGHESISTTEIYTHLDEQQLRDAVDKNPLSNIVKKDKDQS